MQSSPVGIFKTPHIPIAVGMSYVLQCHTNLIFNLTFQMHFPSLASSYLNTIFTLDSADIEINRDAEAETTFLLEKLSFEICLRDANVI